MKKITRQHAIEMFRQLGAMALGHLDETTLSATLDNFEKCRKVQEGYQKLSEELAKRLYEGKDEEEKKAFFELVAKFEKEIADAGIETNAVSPKLLPDYTRHKK